MWEPLSSIKFIPTRHILPRPTPKLYAHNIHSLKMAGSSSLKTLNSTRVFTMKPSSSSSSSPTSSLSSMKLKTLLQTFIFSHMYRVGRALAKAKSVAIQFLKGMHFIHLVKFPLRKNKNNKKKKLFFGSFKLHYNWCSSRAIPVVQLAESCSNYSHVCCDYSWNSVIHNTFDYAEMQGCSNELSRYLEWLEERGDDEDSGNEIDRLADLFIATCHEKFKLEKQESYRRFQEMMARSV